MFDTIFLGLDSFPVILIGILSFIFFHVSFPHTFWISIRISLRFHSIENLIFAISLNIMISKFYWC